MCSGREQSGQGRAWLQSAFLKLLKPCRLTVLVFWLKSAGLVAVYTGSSREVAYGYVHIRPSSSLALTAVISFYLTSEVAGALQTCCPEGVVVKCRKGA